MANRKASSISIVILSLLLAAALATTIVLAAFTAQKTATTTIKFARGLEMKLASAAATNFSAVSVSDNNITITATGEFTGAVTFPVIKAAVNQNADVTLSFAVNFGTTESPSADSGTWAGNKYTSSNGFTLTLTSTSFTDTGLSNAANNGEFAGAMTGVDSTTWAAITGTTTTGMTDLYTSFTLAATGTNYNALANKYIQVVITLDATTA